MTAPPDSRTRLLEAARTLFARDGYDGTSVRAITRRARTNLGAVTYHFGSKQALYYAVIEQFIMPFADRLAEIARSDAPALTRAEAVLREFARQIGDHPEMPRMMVREMASDRPVPPPVARNARRNVESIGRIIADGQREGTIRAGAPMLLAFAIAGPLMFTALAGRIIQQAIAPELRDPAVRAQLQDQIIATALAGLAEPRPERAA